MNRFKITGFVIGFIFMIPMLITAQFTESKQIKKRFKISPETRVEITNKYGKITQSYSTLKLKSKTKNYRGLRK
jgi:hypothetical protein